MEKTIRAILLTNKYCDEGYVMNRPCFMFGCKEKGRYAKRNNEIWVFHCKLHSSKGHMKIIP